jgi:hypothetical protein
VKPDQNVNTHFKYGYTFWYNLNVNQNLKFRWEENTFSYLQLFAEIMATADMPENNHTAYSKNVTHISNNGIQS